MKQSCVSCLVLCGVVLSACANSRRYTMIDDVPDGAEVHPTEQVAGIGLQG
jgi:hypothetical protein